MTEQEAKERYLFSIGYSKTADGMYQVFMTVPAKTLDEAYEYELAIFKETVQ